MITQEFLQQCSDEQINKGVEWMLCKELSLCDHSPFDDYQFGYFNTLNYCTSPNDIMPIAFANMFSICPIFRNSDTYRVGSRCGIYVFNANPLRAICEVYILMSVNK